MTCGRRNCGRQGQALTDYNVGRPARRDVRDLRDYGLSARDCTRESECMRGGTDAKDVLMMDCAT